MKPHFLNSLVLIGTLLAPSVVADGQAADETFVRRALLVGCSEYEHSAIPDLAGPANDVVLMRDALLERLDFDDNNIVTLSEEQGKKDESLRPTRANIQREFRNLAVKSRAGDQVLILLAGHGFQQPDAWPPDEHDIEPDGLDETFAPADTKQGEDGKLFNMIVDDEMRQWVGNITAGGASVCLIVDACHSGTVLRGPEFEVARRIDAEKLGVADALQAARERAREKFGSTRGSYDSSFDAREDLKNVAAMYAAQSYEVEVELPFTIPDSEDETKPYGLLTYTLCQIINSTNSSRPLTYRELVERVRLQYVRMGRTYPTPSVEGENADKELLGVKQWPRRERFVLQQSRGSWNLSAGKVHGLTEGSILAVHAGAADEKPAGYVRIEEADVLTCRVQPCEYKGAAIVEDLPSPAHCEPVFVKFGDLRVKLLPESVDGPKVTQRGPAPDAVVRTLNKLADDKDSLIEVISHPAPNCWRVQVEGDRFYLVPPEGDIRGLEIESPLFGPAPVSEVDVRLGKWLGRIARVELLKRLARPVEAELARGWSDASPEVEVAVVKYESLDDRKGKVQRGGLDRIALHEGEIVGFQVTNRSRNTKIYVTLLFIDGGYGITSVYPGPGEIAEQLEPETSFRTGRFRVSLDTAGTEHLLAIALRATGPPADFTSLEQPTIERARQISETRRGRGPDPLDSQLGKLMQFGLYAEGNTRGLGRVEIDDYLIDLITWKTLPKDGTREQ